MTTQNTLLTIGDYEARAQGDHAQGVVRPALWRPGRSRLDHQHGKRAGPWKPSSCALASWST